MRRRRSRAVLLRNTTARMTSNEKTMSAASRIASLKSSPPLNRSLQPGSTLNPGTTGLYCELPVVDVIVTHGQSVPVRWS